MNSKNRIFIASFAITAILLGAVAGFVAVDLSTERYMPDRFGPLFSIESITSSQVDFSFLGQIYSADLSPLYAARHGLEQFSGLLPAAPRAASSLAATLTQRAIERLEEPGLQE